MIADYHLHTEFSGDCKEPAENQIRRAIELGMTELCITDHHDYDVDSGDVDFNLDLEQYFTRLTALKKKYADQIILRIGIELGLQEHLAAYHSKLISELPLDFVIGSVHFIDGVDPYYPEFFEKISEAEGYLKYFETLYKNIQAFHDFDVAGHLDYIVRYGPNKNRFYSYETYKDIIDAILQFLVSHQLGIECNTGGLRKGLGVPNPHPDVLKRYRELGGEIVTIGSDAHCREDLGHQFLEAEALLKECGFQYYATFEKRQPMMHKL